MTENSLLEQRKALRKALRSKRRALTPDSQARAAQAVADRVLAADFMPLGGHIALFMSADGEIDTAPLLEGLLALGKACYLPVLAQDTVTLQFRRYRPDRPLVTNFLGLQEPDHDADSIAPEGLNTVFMPLVGFDLAGNRLGMGKGYYDRTFAFVSADRSTGPALIGLAHECQRVEHLEAADWDVPLGGILTGDAFYRIR